MSGSLFATSVSISVTQRLSAFWSFLPPAYRLCYASQFSAESSEPFSKEFLRHSLLPVSAAFTAPNYFASTTMLTSCRRPDAPVRMLWRQCVLARDLSTSPQRPCVARLPRPTALPPLLFLSVRHHGYRRHASQPQTAEANLTDGRPKSSANRNVISRPIQAERGIYIWQKEAGYGYRLHLRGRYLVFMLYCNHFPLRLL